MYFHHLKNQVCHIYSFYVKRDIIPCTIHRTIRGASKLEMKARDALRSTTFHYLGSLCLCNSSDASQCFNFCYNWTCNLGRAAVGSSLKLSVGWITQSSTWWASTGCQSVKLWLSAVPWFFVHEFLLTLEYMDFLMTWQNGFKSKYLKRKMRGLSVPQTITYTLASFTSSLSQPQTHSRFNRRASTPHLLTRRLPKEFGVSLCFLWDRLVSNSPSNLGLGFVTIRPLSLSRTIADLHRHTSIEVICSLTQT